MLGISSIGDGLRMKQSGIDNMSVGEKLQAIEALWDALDDDEVKSPDWHYEVLEERSRLLDSGQAELISLDEFKKQI